MRTAFFEVPKQALKNLSSHESLPIVEYRTQNSAVYEAYYTW